MTSPSTFRVRHEYPGYLHIPAHGLQNSDLQALLAVTTERPSNEGRYWVVGWNGHAFEVVDAALAITGANQVSVSMDLTENPAEASMIAYYPIDPRMTVKDIAGSAVAYPNEDNDGWLFRHCDKDFHIDHEFKLLAAVTTAFERQMHVLHKALRTATYSALLSSTSESPVSYTHLTLPTTPYV